MLPLANLTPRAATLQRLATLQQRVSEAGAFADQVAKGKSLWDGKTDAEAGKQAFKDVRDTLTRMCVGARRCHYCEDSAADEIEHIRPKDLFPGEVFSWPNYLFACGPCNGPKGNRHGYVQDEGVVEFRRDRGAEPSPPPPFPDALINPRREDPGAFLDLDLGGVAPDGRVIEGTFEFLPRPELSAADTARAAFTIDVLGLNRQLLIDARANAFTGFRARLREYHQEKAASSGPAVLTALRQAILSTPHLTVLSEMLRQRAVLPFLHEVLDLAPEIESWPLVPGGGR